MDRALLLVKTHGVGRVPHSLGLGPKLGPMGTHGEVYYYQLQSEITKIPIPVMFIGEECILFAALGTHSKASIFFRRVILFRNLGSVWLCTRSSSIRIFTRSILL